MTIKLQFFEGHIVSTSDMQFKGFQRVNLTSLTEIFVYSWNITQLMNVCQFH